MPDGSVSAGGQPVQVQRERDNHNQPQPEGRHGNSQQSHHHAHIIKDGVLLDSRHNPQGNRQQQGEQDAGGRQKHRRGKAVQKLRKDRAPGLVGGAQIAPADIEYISAIAQQKGIVQPLLPAEALHGLPPFTVGASCAANIARITRSSMLEIIRQDYMRTARAKGVSKAAVVLRHGMRNCWIPIITVAGLQFGTLLGGIVIIENVFAWPGVGNFLLTSITSKDTPCVLGAIVLFTVVFSMVNLVVDIIYAFVDPRIKAQYK